MTIPATGHVTYILSAERSHLTAELNGLRTLDLKRDLGRAFATGSIEGIASIQEVAGSYKGQQEDSFAVMCPSSGDGLDAMLQLASEYDQESVLVIIDSGRALLYYCESGRIETIGKYKAIKADQLADHDAWSRVRATGETFTFI